MRDERQVPVVQRAHRHRRRARRSGAAGRAVPGVPPRCAAPRWHVVRGERRRLLRPCCASVRVVCVVASSPGSGVVVRAATSRASPVSTSSSSCAAAGPMSPAASARSVAERARARYAARTSTAPVRGGERGRARRRCSRTVPASPRRTGPVSARDRADRRPADAAAAPRRARPRAAGASTRPGPPRRRPRAPARPARRARRGGSRRARGPRGRARGPPPRQHDRLAADLDDQRLPDRQHGRRARSPRTMHPTSRARSSDVPVNVIAGCSASGIDARRARAGPSTSTPNRPDVCTTIWPALPRPDVGEPAHEARERVVGHREQHELRRVGRPRATSSTGTPGSRASARSRDAAEMRGRRRPPGARRRAARCRGRRRPGPRRRRRRPGGPGAAGSAVGVTSGPASRRGAHRTAASGRASAGAPARARAPPPLRHRGAGGDARSRCSTRGRTGPGVECTTNDATPSRRCSGPCASASDCVRSCGTTTTLPHQPARPHERRGPSRVTPWRRQPTGSTPAGPRGAVGEALVASPVPDSAASSSARGSSDAQVRQHEPQRRAAPRPGWPTG